MRIAIVADDLYPGYGGQAVATEGQIEVLLALGHEVRVLAGAERSPTPPPSEVTLERLPVWRPGEKQMHLALPRQEKTRSLIEWAEVVQINTPTPLALRALRLARREGVPAVMGFHTQEESTTSHFALLSPAIGLALRRWYCHLYRRPDCLIAPTGFAARLARRYTPRPVHVVSNGIRLPADGAAEEESAASLRRRLLAGKRFLLTYLGRLSQEKRPQGLLEIMSALGPLRRDVRLAVAGTGPMRHALERQAAKLSLEKDVLFLGYVSEDEKQILLRASDLFLMPSPTELQSIATLEAMAHRCAVVAARSDTSAVCEMVWKARCGMCYRPDRADGAAMAIVRLLDRPAELDRLRQNAVEAAQKHDVRESGRRLEEIYRSLLCARSENAARIGPLERMV